jgi:hypothetical protein
MKALGCMLLVLLVATSTLTPSVNAAEWDHARERWLVGFSLGGGSAEAQFDADGDVLVSSDRTGGVGFGFRVGYAVRPDLVLGFEGNGWGRSDSETLPFVGDVDVTTTLTVAAVSCTWYPGAGGFFVRGGLGGGTLGQEIEAGGLTIEYDETGFGLHGAVGYEWRVTRTFAIGPQLDLAWMNIGEIDVQDDAGNLVTADVTFNYAIVSVLANWYF